MRIAGVQDLRSAFSEPRSVRERGARAGDAPRAEAIARAEGEAAPDEAVRRGQDEDPRAAPSGEGKSVAGDKLTAEQRAELVQLRQRDAEVRAHEAAHAAAAGSMGGGASFEYTTGPDGRSYAIGGEVSVRISSGNTPEEAIRNAAQVRAAALAPAEPSAQDRAVASEAAAMEAAARAEIAARSAASMPKPAEASSEPDPGEERDPQTTAARRMEIETAPAKDPEEVIRALEGEQRATRGGWRHLHADTGCGPCGMAAAAYR